MDEDVQVPSPPKETVPAGVTKRRNMTLIVGAGVLAVVLLLALIGVGINAVLSSDKDHMPSAIVVTRNDSELQSSRYPNSDDQQNKPEHGRLEVLDSKTGKLKRLLAEGGHFGRVTLSPNGKTVYYEVGGRSYGSYDGSYSGSYGGSRCDTIEIHSISIKGGKSSLLVNGGTGSAVSPDGTKIAFIKTDSCNAKVLAVKDLHSGSEHIVARDAARYSSSAAASSPVAWLDGSHVVLTSDDAYGGREELRSFDISAPKEKLYKDGELVKTPKQAKDGATYSGLSRTPKGSLVALEKCCDEDSPPTDWLSLMPRPERWSVQLRRQALGKTPATREATLQGTT